MLGAKLAFVKTMLKPIGQTAKGLMKRKLKSLNKNFSIKAYVFLALFVRNMNNLNVPKRPKNQSPTRVYITYS